MGRVIPLGKNGPQVNEELVERLEELLAGARRGQIVGMAAAFDVKDGLQRILTEGTLANDNDRTMRIVAKALEVYCTQARIANPLEEPPLRRPRRLLLG